MDSPTTPPRPLEGRRRVVVAMSGGVDSSVVAALLCEAGDEVVGVTLRLLPCEQQTTTRSCCGVDGLMQARAVAARLGIAHYVLNCEREFAELILRPAWDEYARGRTPSACLWCNERVKFGLLWDWAAQLGSRAVATGHYARIVYDAAHVAQLRRGIDRDKDQSYFLARLSAAQLARSEFPLGGMCKPEVRALAKRFDLPTAERKESQDACLVSEGESFAEMLRRRFDAPVRPGRIVDHDGHVLGAHSGVHGFTIGQRRGLGVSMPSRAWVAALDAESGDVTLTRDDGDLAARSVRVSQLNWLAAATTPLHPVACRVQLRYRQAAQAARLVPLEPGKFVIELEAPLHAVAPGQAAVFYDDDRVLGSAWIDAAH